MKFTCESCSAQYMISDEKVGPSGVKVRCKKCGHVIVVRRAEPAAAASAPRAPEAPAAARPSAAAAGSPAPGLDAELGHAFDQAFGDTPPSASAPAAAPAQDLVATQMMGSEDAAKVFADPPTAPAATEWYVAIGQAQVGPLPLAEVKRKWEAGDVGPDSLVWRPGMTDWAPVTGVAELAGYLAPVPRAGTRSARGALEAAVNGAASDAQAPAPAAEPTWKPVGASALAALASEEIASRAAPEPRPAPRPAHGGVRSLVDALPDGGGVDPTGALPLSIKALEATTGEKKLERRSSVARGAQQARQRRGTARAVAIGIVVGLLLVGGAAAGAVYVDRRMAPPPAPALAAAAVHPAPAPAVPAAAAPAPAPAAEPAPAQPAVATEVPSAGAPVAAAEPKERPAQAEKVSPPAPKPARAESARRDPPRKEATRVAAAPPAPAPPPPAPAAAPASRRKGDSLLDFEASDDSALNDALGGGGASAGRSVYVPPARAGGAALPDKVSPGDINAAVAQRIDALRTCVAEQKAREPDGSGTLKMRWVIQGDGSVRDVKCLTSEYAQGSFAQCIAGVVKTIKFPRSATAGQEVTFPFNF